MAKTKATYVDGFVLVVPKKNLAAYKKMAEMGKKMWMKAGALDYKECVLQDPKAQWTQTFPQFAKAKPDETVFFSYITFKDKKHRDAVNKVVMKGMDAEMEKMQKAGKEFEMPFDMKKMAYGGFKVVVDGQ